MSSEVRGSVKWVEKGQFIGKVEPGRCSIVLGDGGISPMKLLLLGVAGCTAYDVVMILQKMREPIEGLEVEISGERREEHPRMYEKVHLHYRIYGNVKDEKAKRAIELSQDKYCSASAHIKLSGAKLTYSYEIIKS
ncbi:OsmC family protein [Thermococcus piezophilus]|uniref:Osmotically inducible protein OsmC n=1 Tax=Thermococcus piezophilus TaxID=1712654 RepID=A0A172WFG0_9EURY|nr:OsmC family protein [Thermococcus piezophilus]ANF22109.1 osmotically inducible protein OsmC [Thermococcus piezophilus]